MKNKLALYATVLLTIGGTVSSFSAFAAEVNQEETNATVQFVAGDGPTDPLDPTDPDQPTDPVHPTDPEDPDNPGTGETGPLTMDYLSNIQFGEQKISGTQKVYGAKNTKPYIQVTDKRGTGGGWSVTAAATPFMGKDAGSQEVTLKGAQLAFKNGKVKTQTTNMATAPIASEVIFDNEDAKLVLNAAQDTGQGTWLEVFENAENDITLSVPGGVAKNGITYQAKIRWVLSDVPQ